MSAGSEAAAGAGETPSPAESWCRVLESYDLDREQAVALTRIVAIRSETWRARCQSLIADAKVRDSLIPPPTDPSILEEGLDMYLERRGLKEAAEE